MENHKRFPNIYTTIEFCWHFWQFLIKNYNLSSESESSTEYMPLSHTQQPIIYLMTFAKTMPTMNARLVSNKCQFISALVVVYQTQTLLMSEWSVAQIFFLKTIELTIDKKSKHHTKWMGCARGGCQKAISCAPLALTRPWSTVIYIWTINAWPQITNLAGNG